MAKPADWEAHVDVIFSKASQAALSEIAGNDQFKRMSAAHGMIAAWVKLFKRLNEDARLPLP